MVAAAATATVPTMRNDGAGGELGSWRELCMYSVRIVRVVRGLCGGGDRAWMGCAIRGEARRGSDEGGGGAEGLGLKIAGCVRGENEVVEEMKLLGWMDGWVGCRVWDGMGREGRDRFSSVCCFGGKEAK